MRSAVVLKGRVYVRPVHSAKKDDVRVCKSIVNGAGGGNHTMPGTQNRIPLQALFNFYPMTGALMTRRCTTRRRDNFVSEFPSLIHTRHKAVHFIQPRKVPVSCRQQRLDEQRIRTAAR
jgi:hypothetical protein